MPCSSTPVHYLPPFFLRNSNPNLKLVMAVDVSTKEEKDLLGKVGDKREFWDGKLPPMFQDLNLPPPPTPAPSYSSVCTLEKVKVALQRANFVSTKSSRSPNPNPNPNSNPNPTESSPAMEQHTKSDNKQQMDSEDLPSVIDSSRSMTMSICPGCFHYLLVPEVDPTCPRCATRVPVVGWNGRMNKKAKVDQLHSTNNSSN